MRRKQLLTILLLLIFVFVAAIEVFTAHSKWYVILLSWGCAFYLISKESFTKMSSLWMTVGYLLFCGVAYCMKIMFFS